MFVVQNTPIDVLEPESNQSNIRSNNNTVATIPVPDSSEPIPVIDQLYSPKFPLEIVQKYVMGAVKEAVEINQIHNRDPIGGSNENLFL